jgi:drug/metabolite transporter (DMT)-like permease
MTKIYTTLLFGVIVVSFGSLLTRWTGDVPFAVISFYRLVLSLPFLFVIYILRKKPKPLKSKTFKIQLVFAGFFLAAHFITWIASIQMTTIANSIFLESTHPFFGLILSVIVLKEFPRLTIIPAFFIAFLGMFLIVYSDWNITNSKTLGDLLAISSALFLALYLLIARFNRDNVDLIYYLIYVYGCAAIFCAVYILINNLSFVGYLWNSWLFLLLLALGPNLIGHSLLNWASRKIEIYKVNLMLLLEPVLATLMAIIFLFEFPKINFYLGAALIIFSLLFIIYFERKGKSVNNLKPETSR